MRRIVKRVRQIGVFEAIKKMVGFDEVYAVLYRKREKGEKKTPFNKNINFDVLSGDTKGWYADPMLFSYNGVTALFMEYYEYATQVGSIACSVVNADGVFSNPQIIISEKYHMSFPSVFEWGEKIYMIPETSEIDSICLYECVAFPMTWKKVAVIDVGMKLVDSIVLQKRNNVIEILSSEINPEDSLQCRFRLFSIEKKDAGFLFEMNTQYNEKMSYGYDRRNGGQLIRESNKSLHIVQVSTEKDYGKKINIYQYIPNDSILKKYLGEITIDNLNVCDISKKKMIGVHTYCLNEEYEIIDLRYLKYRPLKWYYKLKVNARRNKK